MDKANFEIKFKSQDVFGEGGPFAGGDVEEKTRQAFKITVKKLDKLNAPSEKHKEDLRRERLDQVSREFPFPKCPGFFRQSSCCPSEKKGQSINETVTLDKHQSLSIIRCLNARYFDTMPRPALSTFSGLYTSSSTSLDTQYGIFNFQ